MRRKIFVPACIVGIVMLLRPPMVFTEVGVSSNMGYPLWIWQPLTGASINVGFLAIQELILLVLAFAILENKEKIR